MVREAVTRESIEEYAGVIRERYRVASREEKGRLLVEFCAVTGYHRKAAIRLLGRKRSGPGKERRGRPVRYGPAVKAVLVVAWETLGRPCGKRLQPFLGEVVAQLERHGEVTVDEETCGLLEQMSASTIDRLLRSYRRRRVRQPRGSRLAEGSLRQEVPVRTFGEWRDERPGAEQVDLVLHCGESTGGFYLTTLMCVDVATSWTAREAVWGMGQVRVGGAIQHVRLRLPFRLRSLHSDNGGEFLNRALVDWCRRGDVRYTRGRPHRKNDQAWVEQRNDTGVRKLVGYLRYSSKAAFSQLGRVYRIADDYANYFQPVAKLVEKRREGARVTKVYDRAQTPYQRLLSAGVLDDEARLRMEQRYQALNPAQLRRDLDAALEALWRQADATPSGISLRRQVLDALG
jgi:hypothetical protein